MLTSQKGRNRHRQKTMLSALLSAWGLSLLSAIPLLLLLAAIAYRSSDPRAGLSVCATVVLVALSLSAGYIAARGYRRSEALVGFLAGAGISLSLFGLGLSVSGANGLSSRLLMLLLIPILGLLGGRLGARRHTRRRRPR
ncbi:MAG: TIGR04086 family membrane protein [Clostridia bacterium]|nr:TIGR04086 family membrane protein [Clostridia bacterium]